MREGRTPRAARLAALPSANWRRLMCLDIGSTDMSIPLLRGMNTDRIGTIKIVSTYIQADKPCRQIVRCDLSDGDAFAAADTRRYTTGIGARFSAGGWIGC